MTDLGDKSIKWDELHNSSTVSTYTTTLIGTADFPKRESVGFFLAETADSQSYIIKKTDFEKILKSGGLEMREREPK